MKNMNQMMKQVKKMQAEMERVQKELEERQVEGSAGGGAVRVTVNGKKEVLAVHIDPEAIDPQEREMLEEMILTAVNQALSEVDKVASEAMGHLTGGMNFPGIPGLR
ncbi:MAG: YbaB/EbfC family nucleoid-associated protein [Firmicutes bacterium]|nr:YbaB/EbfC family nucleoid-associated protein [Bacillota bacterium]